MSWRWEILLLLGLSRVVSVDLSHKFDTYRLLEKIDNSVIDGISVFVQPAGHIVGNSSGIMDNSKVSILVSLGHGLDKIVVFAKMLSLEFGLKGLIRSLRVDGLFLKDGQETHGLLKQLNTSRQVHTEIHGDPLDSLPHVFLLLQDKHVMVEELLELLIHEVDTKLLKCIKLKYLKSSNVKHTDKVDFLHAGVDKGAVTHVDEVSEETTKDVLDDGAGTNDAGVDVLGLVNPFRSNL